MTDEAWDTDEGGWHHGLDRFIARLNDARGSGFWTTDFELKYLTLRINTRDNGFLLYGDKQDGTDDKIPIHPKRVIAAIDKH